MEKQNFHSENNIQNKLHELLYEAQAIFSIGPVFYYLVPIIQFLQIFFLTFRDKLREVWLPEELSKVLSYGASLIELPYLMKNNFTLYSVCIYISVILLAFTATLIILSMVNSDLRKKKKINFIVLNISFKVFGCIFYLPILDLLVSIIDCKDSGNIKVLNYYSDVECFGLYHSFLLSMSVIGILILVPIGFIVVATLYDLRIKSSNPLSKVDCHSDLLKQLYNTVLIIGFYFSTADKKYYGCLLLLLEIHYFTFLYKSHPFYSLNTQKAYLTGSLLCGWSFFMYVFFAFTYELEEEYFGAIGFLIGVPLLIYIGWNTENNMNSFISKSEAQINDPIKIIQKINYLIHIILNKNQNRRQILILKGFIKRHLGECKNPKCPMTQFWKIYSSSGSYEDIISTKGLDLMNFYLEKIYNIAIERFPESKELLLGRAIFLLQILNKNHVALHELVKMAKQNNDFIIGFQLNPKELVFRRIIEAIPNSEKNIHLLDFKLETKAQKFENILRKSGNFYLRFWTYLQEESPTLKKIEALGKNILHMGKEIEEMWEELISIRVPMPHVYYMFAQYQGLMLGDNDRSLNYLEKSREEENAKKSLYSTHSTDLLYKGKIGYSIIQIDADEKPGTIIGCSASICQLFGYPKNKLIGKPLDMLIPQIYHESDNFNHKTIVIESISTKPDNYEGHLQVFGKHISGYVLPINIVIKKLQDYYNNSQFIGCFQLKDEYLKEQQSYVLIDNKFIIKEVTSSASIQMRLLEKFVKSSKLDIREFVPALKEDKVIQTIDKNVEVVYIFPDFTKSMQITIKTLIAKFFVPKNSSLTKSTLSPSKTKKSKKVENHPNRLSTIASQKYLAIPGIEKGLFNLKINYLSSNLSYNFGYSLRFTPVVPAKLRRQVKERAAKINFANTLIESELKTEVGFFINEETGLFYRDIIQTNKKNKINESFHFSVDMHEKSLKLLNNLDEYQDFNIPKTAFVKTAYEKIERILQKIHGAEKEHFLNIKEKILKMNYGENVSMYRLDNTNNVIIINEQETDYMKEEFEEDQLEGAHSKKKLNKIKNEKMAHLAKILQSRKTLQVFLNDNIRMPLLFKIIIGIVLLAIPSLITLAITQNILISSKLKIFNTTVTNQMVSVDLKDNLFKTIFHTYTLILVNEGKFSSFGSYTEKEYLEFAQANVETNYYLFLNNTFSYLSFSPNDLTQEHYDFIYGNNLNIYEPISEDMPMEQSRDVSLITAIEKILGNIYIIMNIDPSEVNLSNQSVLFILYNILLKDIVEAIDTDVVYFTNELNENASTIRTSMIWFFAGSLCLAFIVILLDLCLILKVRKESNQLLKCFLSFSFSKMKEKIKTTENFFAVIAGHSNEGDSDIFEGSYTEDTPDKESVAMKKIKGFSRMNKRRFKISISEITTNIILMLALYCISCSSFIYSFVRTTSFINNFIDFKDEITYLSKIETSSSYQYILNLGLISRFTPVEIIETKSAEFYNEDDDLYNNLEKLRQANGDKFSPTYASLYTAITKFDLCEYVSSEFYSLEDCHEFQSGIASQGLLTILLNSRSYSDSFFTIYNQFKAMSSTEEELAAYLSQVLQSDSLNLFNVILQNLIMPGIHILFDAIMNEISSFVDNESSNSILVYLFISVTISIFSFGSIAMIVSMHKRIKKIKMMVSILPLDLISPNAVFHELLLNINSMNK